MGCWRFWVNQNFLVIFFSLCDLISIAFSPTVIENVGNASYKVEMAEENVVGVRLPTFRRFGEDQRKGKDEGDKKIEIRMDY
jgi:vacuolar-type H+-ATPase subunit D/Vma8